MSATPYGGFVVQHDLFRALMKKISLVLCFAVSVSIAAQGSVWEQKTLEDFASGKLTNLSINSRGEVSLAPELTPLAQTQELYVWSLVSDRAGTIYIGTGNEGKVFRIDSRGTITEIFDSPETGILSLAIDRQGTLYAASMPNGIIYKISPKGNATVFYDTEDSYVWSLCFDPAGNLYAGTGNKGRIYNISPAGEGKIIYESDQPHIMSLLASKGSLYASSSGDGLVYKIRDGEVMLLYDADEPEARLLVEDQKGTIYFATNPSTESSADDEHFSRVYRLRQDGITEYLWTAPDSLILSMTVDPDGNLLVGTGNKGKIYRVTANGEPTILTQCQETQVLALYRQDKTVFVGTGNLGSVYRLGPARAESGTIDSWIFDTGTTSRWGKIDWEGTTPSPTQIILETKTGNRKESDPTWSNWARPESDIIKNPPARFIQWRALLKTQKPGVTPVLKKVTVSYLPANLKPEIAAVALSKPGADTPGSSSDYSEKKPSKTERKISWSSWDPNGDSLVFKLFFKGTGERNWKLIKEDITAENYLLDTQTLPDGWYEVKIVGSDSPVNPGDLALEGEKVSEPFLVNNTPARIENVKAGATAQNKYRITFTATSALSPIRSAGYSINTGKWLPVSPRDGIFDSKSEDFSFETKLSSGEYTIVVKVTDEFDNVATAKEIIEAR